MVNKLVSDYYRVFNEYEGSLFALYDKETIVPKFDPRGNGWTWGYRMLVNGVLGSGSSIGKDEIKFFFDTVNLIDAKFSFCVGVAFGLSTFCIALAKPDNIVYSIDNYSERPGEATDYIANFVRSTVKSKFKNIHLYIGTSPEDTASCLSNLPQDKKLSMVFIDGLHTDSAATKDYEGVRAFIDSRTLVFWHNTYGIFNSFKACYDSTLFDRSFILRTWGVMGVYYNSKEHPEFESYLKSNCLIWNDWRENFKRLTIQHKRWEQAFKILRKARFFLRK